MIGMADALDRLRPDVLVVLGDRFETLAAAQAALLARIPIAHIHGGETTEGAIDESIRHAITKMAHLHFVAATAFRRRVVQLGEHPDRVVESGAPGLDFIRQVDVMSRSELEASLDFELGEPTLLVTYHPATLQDRDPSESVQNLLNALDHFPEAHVVFTKANADTHGRIINERIEAYAQSREHARLYASLGQRRYVSALHHVDVVVGNSSSGIIEAPAIPVPTVNLGDRQKGRPRAKSVIDCIETEESIVDAMHTALSSAFRETLSGVRSPYGDGYATSRIVRHLKTADLSTTVKRFYDLPVERLCASASVS
jgi:UDP-N-acetylglucosamine 2-epimerase (non-hydrolysing)/GDP/UDP-N,N'-diacetylbacillosamine 2-epimerase (hydrolysing)